MGMCIIDYKKSCGGNNGKNLYHSYQKVLSPLRVGKWVFPSVDVGLGARGKTRVDWGF